ncbi:hypothetical protein OM076_41140 [Solirubrobacter ginsenosidimutans]|uniref:Uncharacterized protein n=1 Tax=Solirubrobacter ginsenosidimutans TaxID=490573 RepID=A0A9X3S5F3_9ACTN|nr:hypothetical protein [Solirubrobacter ginsenosidimutans]MDA0166739.1 hypothetical protein [Solirubrobacter ginsenosidimutans]
MDRAHTRHVGLGITGALVTCTRDAAALSLWAAKAGSNTPLLAPLRRPARRIAGAAEHRGALNEARLLSDARHISSEWLAGAVRGPLLEHVVRTLVEAGALERVAVHLQVTEQLAAGEEPRRVVIQIARSDERPDTLARQTDGLVDDPGDTWRDETPVDDQRMAGLGRRRLHTALLAGFEEGAAPA